MNPVYIIISSIGGSATLFLALAWLTRKLLSQLLAKDVEKFKSELQLRTNIELSEFKSTLELAAYEHQYRFGRLHEKRAEIISELYSAIFDLQKSVGDFIDSLPVSTPEHNKKNLLTVWKAADHFKAIYGRNRIYFNESVCFKIERLNASLSAPVSTLAAQMNLAGEQNWDSLGKIWLDAQGKFDSEVPDIKNELENEFRMILGVQKHSKEK